MYIDGVTSGYRQMPASLTDVVPDSFGVYGHVAGCRFVEAHANDDFETISVRFLPEDRFDTSQNTTDKMDDEYAEQLYGFTRQVIREVTRRMGQERKQLPKADFLRQMRVNGSEDDFVRILQETGAIEDAADEQEARSNYAGIQKTANHLFEALDTDTNGYLSIPEYAVWFRFVDGAKEYGEAYQPGLSASLLTEMEEADEDDEDDPLADVDDGMPKATDAEVLEDDEGFDERDYETKLDGMISDVEVELANGLINFAVQQNGDLHRLFKPIQQMKMVMRLAPFMPGT